MFNLNYDKMKKVMFALCFMFGGIVTLSAQDTQDTTSNQYRTETQSQYPQMPGQDQDRERIQATELPDEVKRSLEGEEYRGWLISGAFKAQGSADQSLGADTTNTDPSRQPSDNATGTEGEEIYVVELKNGAETKTVNFTSDGQKLEGMEEQNTPNSQFNQNDQMDQTSPADQPQPIDPTRPTDPAVPADPAHPTDPTRPSDPAQPADPNATDPNATDRPDQSQSGQSASPSQPGQSTSTPSGQSTPTEPK